MRFIGTALFVTTFTISFTRDLHGTLRLVVGIILMVLLVGTWLEYMWSTLYREPRHPSAVQARISAGLRRGRSTT